MEPTRPRRERRINAPLPRFLPETPEEKEAHILEQLRHRVEAYIADHHTLEWQALRDQTEQRQETVENEHVAVSAMTRKKHVQMPADMLSQLEHHRMQYDRVNEDTIRLGRNWYVVADGISAYQRNVCGLMGEAVGLVMEQVALDLQSRTPLPDEQTVQQALRKVPDLAQKFLAKMLQASEAYTKAEGDRKLLDTDFGTTVEIVLYAEWLERAFVVHVGDSRTYKIAADHTATQLTRDHVVEDSGKKIRGMESFVSTDSSSQKYVDVFSEPLLPGERVASMTDGCFAGQERLRKHHRAIPDMQRELEDLSYRSPHVTDFSRAAVVNGEGYQEEERFWDDASCAAIERKA